MGSRGPGASAFRLATRRSPLARLQAERVAERLRATGEVGEVVCVGVETTGDRQASRPLESFGERGIFITEVEQAVLDGRADVAVHSAKDLPSESPPAGLVLAAVPERADPRDALVGGRLDDLAPGALVATGAIRRRVQLAAYRPDLAFTGLRGNIATRLERVPPSGAVVVALAALERLGLVERIDEVLPISVLLPQVGQGAIALRCREDDAAARQLLGQIDEPTAHRCLEAERAFLAHLGGGCEAPVGAYATVDEDGQIVIEGMLAAPDGHVVLRRRHRGDEAASAGHELAELLLRADGGADLLGGGLPS